MPHHLAHQPAHSPTRLRTAIGSNPGHAAFTILMRLGAGLSRLSVLAQLSRLEICVWLLVTNTAEDRTYSRNASCGSIAPQSSCVLAPVFPGRQPFLTPKGLTTRMFTANHTLCWRTELAVAGRLSFLILHHKNSNCEKK